MKTDELIGLLATGVEVVEPRTAARRFAIAIGGGVLGSATLMLYMIRLRPDLAEAVFQPMFWLKTGFVASVLAAALFAAARLSRPGARLGRLPGALAAPVALMWAIAAYVLLAADASQRPALFFGATWRVCPLLIAQISAPAFIAAMLAVKGLAPTRPCFAGFAAGLLAGAIAALVYCLHCPEMGAPFIAFWYLLGMLIPAAAGAGLGHFLLRW